MGIDNQAPLLEMPEQPAIERRPVTAAAKLRTVDRNLPMLAQIVAEELIPQDHKARAIWALVGHLDLSRFELPLKSRQGCVGRPAWDPHLLVSLWIYAYSERISSARELERLMEWEPGLQWLGGLKTVSCHTLSDFRVDQREALDELFAQLLGVLESQGVLSLERVMHDGTKIRAQAGADTFRREKSLKEHLERARQAVKEMGDPRAEETPAKRAARQRGVRERENRIFEAWQEMEAAQAAARTEKEKQEVRVSLTEPEARRMKHGDNAIAPSYNAQISTDAQNKIIVGAHLSQSSSDAQSLMPAIEEVKKNLHRQPNQMVVDGGFTNRDNIVACAEKQIDLIGSLADPLERSAAAMKSAGIDPAFAPHHFKILEGGKQLECPSGCVLNYVGQSRKRGDQYERYRAGIEDCRQCQYQARCCSPKTSEQGRTVSIKIGEKEEVSAFRKKMAAEESKAIYRQRGPVAEFPNAWIKEKLGLRKFRVRGLIRAGSELLWACLTYNIMQAIRLSPVQAVVA